MGVDEEAMPAPLLDELEDTDAISSGDDMALLHQFHSLPNRQPSGGLYYRCSTRYIVIVALAILVLSVATLLVVLKFGLQGFHGGGKRVVRFLHISDTHLDLYYDSTITNKDDQYCRNKLRKDAKGEIEKLSSTCVFGRSGCDTPLLLLESLGEELSRVSSQLKKKGGEFDFILITGDQVGHEYGDFKVDVLNSVIWSLVNSTQIISKAVPGVPILMSVGNNDLTLDYNPPVTNHSTFYSLLFAQLQNFIFVESSHSNATSKLVLQSTFEYGGYYSVCISESTTVLVLNTNYWATTAFSLNRKITSIGDQQLHWLQKELQNAEANERQVIISRHIPPGVDTYVGKSLWLQNYTEAYIRMVTSYQGTVLAQLFGHIHQDKIKFQQIEGQKQQYSNTSDVGMNSFLLTCPSITPIYGNNPGYREYTYVEKKQDSLDYTQYYLDLAASNVEKKAYWLKEYSFRDTYKVKLSSTGVKQFINDLLRPQSDTWLHYSQHMVAGGGGVTNKLRYREFCGARHYSLLDYENCIRKYQDAGT